MVETLSELLENAANVAEDNGGKLSIASAAVLIAEAYELGMTISVTISILTTAPCGCSVKEGTSLILVCAQVIDWVRFPTAAHPEPCNSNPIRCLERNNQPNRLK